MVNDTISDMLTRLRNAYLANKEQTSLTATRVVKDIAQVLVQEGFLGPIEQEDRETSRGDHRGVQTGHRGLRT